MKAIYCLRRYQKEKQEWSSVFQQRDPNLLQQIQRGQNQSDVILAKLKQYYEGLCRNQKFIHKILPIAENRMSIPELIYERNGNITYQVVTNCDVTYREIPELILINCQIKEVNQKDDEIVQLICKGLGILSDTNIYVFIDNLEKNQKHFQVDQIIPALNRRTIYQVGCPVINCFAQPMGVLDNKCFYAFKITNNRNDLKYLEYNLDTIKLLGIELDKYPSLAKEEFIQIFSKNTVQSGKQHSQVSISSFVSNILKEQPSKGKEDQIIYVKMDIGDLSIGSLVILDKLPSDIILTVKTDIEILLEITKEMMFWMRFLVESCQVYNPKNIGFLKQAIKPHF